MLKSKCYQKYGEEWSKGLTETTRKHMEGIGTGFVKHIEGRCGRIAFTNKAFDFDFEKYMKLIPESELSRKVFIVALQENCLLDTAPGSAFDCAYDSVQDMIDDGWVLD